MLVQEKAPEITAQALTEAVASVVVRQPTYIILDADCQTIDSARQNCDTERQGCDTAYQNSDAHILPLTEIAAQLREAAVQRLAYAYQALQETQTLIAQERAGREQQLEIARATLAVVQKQFANLEQERAAYEKQAQTFLDGPAREHMLAQIHAGFQARQRAIETQLAQAQQALSEGNSEHYAAIIGEELELGLLHSDIETLRRTAPEVAAEVERAQAAPQYLAQALQAARAGAIADAEDAFARACSGNIPETELAAARDAIAQAKQRALTRELIAAIQNVSAELPGATAHLKRLAQRAHEQNVYPKVESFLQRAFKQARASAAARYREATLHAEYLADQGFIPCIGDGRIEAWQHNQHGWTLAQMATYQQDSWVTHHPRARITRRDVPRRVRRSPWYRRTHAAHAA